MTICIIYFTLYINKYIIYRLTLFCILTSILGSDSNRETISLCPYFDARINAVSPSYIIYIYILLHFIYLLHIYTYYIYTKPIIYIYISITLSIVYHIIFMNYIEVYIIYTCTIFYRYVIIYNYYYI